MQKYMVDYQCYDKDWENNSKTGITATYNKYCFAKSPDREAVTRAINAHKESHDVVMRAWVIEWNNHNAEHKLVIGDPSTSPPEPGTIFLRRVRAEAEKEKAIGEEGRRQLALIPKKPIPDAVMDARMIAHDRKIAAATTATKPVVVSSPPALAVKLYQPYAPPKVAES